MEALAHNGIVVVTIRMETNGGRCGWRVKGLGPWWLGQGRIHVVGGWDGGWWLAVTSDGKHASPQKRMGPGG